MLSGWIKSYQRAGLNRFHPYHMVKPSIWPFLTSVSLFFLVVSMISTFYETNRLLLVFHIGPFNIFFIVSLLFLFINMYGWWSDVSIESGEHTQFVVQGLKIGMVLFIASEVLFFFSFFWALFQVSLSPDIQIGGVWPPVGFESMVLDFKKVPLLNTVLLLSSGITVTYAHLAFFVNFNLTEPFVFHTSRTTKHVVHSVFPNVTIYGEQVMSAPYEVNENNVRERKYIWGRDPIPTRQIYPRPESFIKTYGTALDLSVFDGQLTTPKEVKKAYFFKGDDRSFYFKVAALLKALGGSHIFIKKYCVKDLFRQSDAATGLIKGLWAMVLTISFALLFLSLQLVEYFEAFFSISDSVYGSTFFVMTGFHGLHVLVGTIFLIVSTYRIANGNFFGRHSTGLECAIWYWHFVDVVWLFLYISIYYWGNIVIADFNYDLYFIGNLSDVRSDYAENEALFFQDPATGFMEKIIELHNYIMQILVIVGFIIFFILYDILYR